MLLKEHYIGFSAMKTKDFERVLVTGEVSFIGSHFAKLIQQIEKGDQS